MTRRLQDEFEELAQLPLADQDRYAAMIHALKLAEWGLWVDRAVTGLGTDTVIEWDA
jgi:hypothetical protein